ncbi:MAG TPA: VOC family protein [Vicinamibacteria bacterium]|jgi:predicted enzyme related to lactoylglutathione lyase
MAKLAAGTRRAAKKKAKSGGHKKKAPKAAGKSSEKKATIPRRPTGNAASAARFPNAIGLQIQHVDFLTLRPSQVKRFYTEVLGFKQFRQEPKLNYLYIRTAQGASLGFMPPNPQMLGEQPPPREPTLYFLVDDVDRVYAKLVAKGVSFIAPPTEMPWGHRVITTQDPEGRTVMLASEK